MTNPNNVAFSIFGFDIMWYAILIVLGIILGVTFAVKISKKYKWAEEDILDFALLAIPLAIVGARLFYVFMDWDQYKDNLLLILNTRRGGLAIYGGLIGGVLGGIIFCKWRKKSFLELFDICAPSIALGQAIGRWGNFVNQEAYGPLVTNPSHMWFPLAVKIDATQTIHYATFFYESLWCALIFIFLISQRKKFKHVGDIGLMYVLLYSFERMFVEGLRQDSLYIGSIRVSQALSVLLFLGTLVFFLLRAFREKNQTVLITNKLNKNYIWPETEPVATPSDQDMEEQSSDVTETGDDDGGILENDSALSNERADQDENDFTN